MSKFDLLLVFGFSMFTVFCILSSDFCGFLGLAWFSFAILFEVFALDDLALCFVLEEVVVHYFG